ncbi:MAG: tetratricopeptide repeat protein [Gaiellales bacterium]
MELPTAAITTERVIRVFVSSTFRDMQAEREELVKWVFPQLRKRCDERRVTWSEVDLRWGITDEQKAEGKVLPICLAEIKRCRPYFIGLLGERYGWVPDEIDQSLLAEQPWLAEHTHRSITELEVLHGVLNAPEMANHAFFYLRDPAYTESVPDEERAALLELPNEAEIELFGPEEAERRAVGRRRKLVALKERIRTSGFPVADYANPKTLGELVHRDLGRVIDDLFPEGSEPDPLDVEAEGHEAFARSRTSIYIGPRECLEQLDHHANGDAPPVVVLGESGAGKTALLANWALRWRETHPDDLVLMHFIGGTRGSTEWAAMVRRFIGEIDRWDGGTGDRTEWLRRIISNRRVGREDEIPTDPEELKAAFADSLYTAAKRGRVVLVLDALNQLEDRDGAPDLRWLPPALPSRIRVVSSTLPGRPLDEATRRGWRTLDVPPLDEDERRELVAEYLAQYSKELASEHVDRIVQAPQSANPLFLSAMLEELRLWGDHETLGHQIDHYLAVQAIDDLYERILARYEIDYERDRPRLVGDAVSLLWAARRGLSEAELLDLLGSDGNPLPRAYWSPLYLAMERSLISRSGVIGFFHDYLRRAVRDRYLLREEDQRPVHVALANYFEARRTTPRGVDELAWQLTEGAQWSRLHDLLTDLDYLATLWEADEFEVRSHWARLESSSDFRMVAAYRPPPADDDSLTRSHSIIAALLVQTGHPAEALAFYERLLEQARKELDYAGIQNAAGNQALILSSWGRLEEALALHREEERICRRFDDTSALAVSLGHQALILKSWGRLDEAMSLVEEQERICRELGYRAGLTMALGNRAGILQDWGRLEEASTLLDEVEQICKEQGDRLNLHRMLGQRGQILHAWGRLEESMSLHEQQERICRELGDIAGLATCLGSQAAILKTWGRIDDAVVRLEEEEQIYRSLDDKAAIQRSLGNRAAMLRGLGRLDDAMALLDEQERGCRELGDRKGLAFALSGRAMVLKDLGRPEEAMVLLKEQEQICSELGDKKELNFCLGRQAVILRDWGRSHGALELLKQSEEISREIGDRNGLQASLGTQGQVLQDWGRLDEAMSLLKEQERICREIGDQRCIGVAVGNQALVLRDWGRLEEAMPLLEEQARISRAIGSGSDLSIALGNQGLVLHDLDRPEEAMPLFEEQERICREIGDRSGVQSAIGHKALALEDMGRRDEAMALLQEQERMCREISDRGGLARSLGNQARLLRDEGRLEEALTLFEQSAEVAREAGNRRTLRISLGHQSELLYHQDRFEEALARLEELDGICRELGEKEALRRCLSGKATLLVKLGDTRGAIDAHLQLEEICQDIGDETAWAESVVGRVTLLASLGDVREALQVAEESRRIAAATGSVAALEMIDTALAIMRQFA